MILNEDDEKNLDDIEKIINEINAEADAISNKKIDTSKVPSDFSIMLSGFTSQFGIKNIFSDEVDKLIDNLLKSINNGNFDKVLQNDENIKKLLEKFGFAEGGKFSGKISGRILDSIQKTSSSSKYQKLKSNLSRVMFLSKNLKKEKKNIENPKEAKKYSDAIYAIKQVLKFISRIYKQRRLINDKVMSGLKTIRDE